MASVRPVKNKDGGLSYRAEIVIKKSGEILHRESKTFLKKKLATDWAKRREVELQSNSVYKKREPVFIKELINEYIAQFPPSGRTKSADLKKLLKTEIAHRDIHTLTANTLIEHIKQRNKECLPQTANNDLIWLKSILQTMSAVKNLEIDFQIFENARLVLRKEGLIARAVQRERRPTKQEMWALSRYFYRTNRMMLHIIWFAIYSCRRQAEICKLEWSDINHQNRTAVIRNLKHPTKKDWSQKCKLPKSAYKIIKRQAETKGRIFPMNSKTVGTYFTRACHLLNINDLHFHDLRHHGVSLLFEKDLSIAQVSHISLHTNWSTLKRYCNTDAADVDV